MTKEEIIKVIGIITMAYPAFDKFKDEKHIRSMVTLWADIFSDDDSGLVAMAVKKHISTSKWPPSIAEIREILVDITNPELLPPEAAWTIVSKLLYTVGEFCHEDIRKLLPSAIADTVEALGYHTLYELKRKKSGLARVAFVQAYTERNQRMRGAALLPTSLRRTIEAASSAFEGSTKELIVSMDRRYEEKRGLSNSIGVDLLGIEAPETPQIAEAADRTYEPDELDELDRLDGQEVLSED